MASLSAARAPTLGAAPATNSTSTHPYTCNTCQVAFRNSELQRAHMRSDWHRYNLKRRVTSLPPITSEVFTEKVLQAQASSTAAASKVAYEQTCIVCQRTYFSENAFQNHLGSQKHRTNLAVAEEQPQDGELSSVMSSTFSLGEPTSMPVADDSNDDTESQTTTKETREANAKSSVSGKQMPIRARKQENGTDDERKASVISTAPNIKDEEEASVDSSLERCLFCNHHSPSVPLNATHMEKIHGMFIPEASYLVDLDGLIASLHEKIYEFHECLYCGKLKPSVFGLQTHMRDKGHCKIPFGTEDEQLEIGEFYDFTSTYSDVEDESDSEDALPGEKQSGGVKLGARRKEKTTDNDGDEDMNEADGWETDTSESSLDSADLTAVRISPRTHQYEKLDQHPHHSNRDPRPHHNKDGWHSHAHKHTHAVFYSDYELHLPSGRTAGHRSLNKYYKQNLHSHPSVAERQEQRRIQGPESSESENEDQRITSRRQGHRGRALTTRTNGELGMVGVTTEKRKEVRAAELRSRKVEQRERRKFQWGNNKQSNFQKHFRDPLLQ